MIQSRLTTYDNQMDQLRLCRQGTANLQSVRTILAMQLRSSDMLQSSSLQLVLLPQEVPGLTVSWCSDI
jgi:hypothetical protein